MATISRDDRLMVRAANPRTGLISPFPTASLGTTGDSTRQDYIGHGDPVIRRRQGSYDAAGHERKDSSTNGRWEAGLSGWNFVGNMHSRDSPPKQDHHRQVPSQQRSPPPQDPAQVPQDRARENRIPQIRVHGPEAPVERPANEVDSKTASPKMVDSAEIRRKEVASPAVQLRQDVKDSRHSGVPKRLEDLRPPAALLMRTNDQNKATSRASSAFQPMRAPQHRGPSREYPSFTPPRPPPKRYLQSERKRETGRVEHDRVFSTPHNHPRHPSINVDTGRKSMEPRRRIPRSLLPDVEKRHLAEASAAMTHVDMSPPKSQRPGLQRHDGQRAVPQSLNVQPSRCEGKDLSFLWCPPSEIHPLETRGVDRPPKNGFGSGVQPDSKEVARHLPRRFFTAPAAVEEASGFELKDRTSRLGPNFFTTAAEMEDAIESESEAESVDDTTVPDLALNLILPPVRLRHPLSLFNTGQARVSKKYGILPRALRSKGLEATTPVSPIRGPCWVEDDPFAAFSAGQGPTDSTPQNRRVAEVSSGSDHNEKSSCEKVGPSSLMSSSSLSMKASKDMQRRTGSIKRLLSISRSCNDLLDQRVLDHVVVTLNRAGRAIQTLSGPQVPFRNYLIAIKDLTLALFYLAVLYRAIRLLKKIAVMMASVLYYLGHPVEGIIFLLR